MVFVVSILVLGLLVIGYWLYRSRQISRLEENEISHFSDLGFVDFHLESTWTTLSKRMETEGISLGIWKKLEIGSGIELWGIPEKGDFSVFSPFFRSDKFPAESVKTVTSDMGDGFEVLKVKGQTLVTEKIPFTPHQSGEVYLTAFAIELTAYDSIEMYESQVRASFQKQLISLSVLKMEEFGEHWTPSADAVFSGLVSDYDKMINPETNKEFWLIRVDTGDGFTLPIVADPRLLDRFPQKKNVLVGQVYLLSSETERT